MRFRHLTPGEQEARRLQAVEAVNQGERQADVARRFGVSRQVVHKWFTNHDRRGPVALVTNPAGRPPGSRRLHPAELQELIREMAAEPPGQKNLRWALWSTPAVQYWIARRYQVELSRWTVASILATWGIRPLLPSRVLAGRSETFSRWLREEYPAIRREAQRERSALFWVSDAMSMAFPAPSGRARVHPLAGKGRRSLLLATSPRGQVRFAIDQKRYSARVLVPFLKRLILDTGRNCYVLLPDLPLNRDPRIHKFCADYALTRVRFWPA